MRQIVLNRPLRTGLWAALLITFMGVSACSSEKEAPNSESGEVMAVDQGNESEATELTNESGAAVEGMSSEGTTPMTSSDADMAAGADMSSGDATGGSDMSGATDSGATDESGTDTIENPNADQTAADGLQ